MDINLNKLICHSRIISLAELVELQSQWLELERQANPPFFLRWAWIYNWAYLAKQSNPQFLFMHTKQGQNTVGLALFTCRRTSPLVGIRLNQLWLHRHGEELLDQIWIEHNDVLALPEQTEQVKQAMFAQICRADKRWHEVYVGMSDKGALNNLHLPAFKQRVIIDSQAFRASLKNCADLNAYLSSLSKNTRAQIAKSARNLNQYGDYSLEMAVNEQDKSDYLQHIANLHIERWGHTLHGSGFSNQTFVDFHHRLVLQDTENKNCRLYRLKQNGEALGYVYLLTTEHTWYFYLSAISFHTDPKIKIGMLLHTLIIQQAIQERADYYDFMAGEAQYKRSLSNCPEYNQQLVCYYRPTPFIIVREQLRKLKAWFNQNK